MTKEELAAVDDGWIVSNVGDHRRGRLGTQALLPFTGATKSRSRMQVAAAAPSRTFFSTLAGEAKSSSNIPGRGIDVSSGLVFQFHFCSGRGRVLFRQLSL
jgi:hypothetical protein